jgi:hypothetical protein
MRTYQYRSRVWQDSLTGRYLQYRVDELDRPAYINFVANLEEATTRMVLPEYFSTLNLRPIDIEKTISVRVLENGEL